MDDEADARGAVRRLLEADHEIEIVGECANGRDAIAAIQSLKPHLVFLDVVMPRISGFNVLKAVGEKVTPLVIFVTAFEKYAVRAFKVHAVEYLLKPFTPVEFNKALRYAKDQLRTKNSDEISRRNQALVESVSTHYLERVLIKRKVKGKDVAFLIKVPQIEWIEAEDHYVSLHVGGKSYLYRERISELAAQLDPNRFQLIHRSFIVNLDFIVKLEMAWNHEYLVVMPGGEKLPLSRDARRRLKCLGWDL
ncbi:MAG TPA: LytTR family DNA-binding domain-containing protein [Pyrinomonadaceae bacterium]